MQDYGLSSEVLRGQQGMMPGACVRDILLNEMTASVMCNASRVEVDNVLMRP
jgi:hypothetical protein